MITVHLCRTDGAERILQATSEVNSVYRGIHSLEVTESMCCWFLVDITRLQYLLYQMVNYCLDSYCYLLHRIAAYLHTILYLHKLFHIDIVLTVLDINFSFKTNDLRLSQQFTVNVSDYVLIYSILNQT